MVYCVFYPVATFLYGRDNGLPIRILAGIYQGRRVCGVVENEGVRTHGYGLAMLGLIALLDLRGQIFTMEDASDPPHPPDPLSNGPRVWANVCDPL